MFRRIRQDLQAVFDRDPAATSRLEVLFTYAGFHALLAYRLAHWLRDKRVPFVPRAISQLARWLTGDVTTPDDTKILRELGVTGKITRTNAFSMLRSLAQTMRALSYSGLVLLFDEVDRMASIGGRAEKLPRTIYAK